MDTPVYIDAVPRPPSAVFSPIRQKYLVRFDGPHELKERLNDWFLQTDNMGLRTFKVAIDSLVK